MKTQEMRRVPCLALLCICLSTLIAVLPTSAEDWPQFRGVSGSGVAPTAELPESWDVESGVNIAWQVDLPGQGPSSPIVVDGQVIVTCSGGRHQSQLYVLAFDAKTGQPLWKRSFLATGRTLTHATSANAAPTPVSDGVLVVAFYSSNDVICLDLDGNLQWYRGLAIDHPKLGNDIGMASSPVIIGDTVILQAESQGDAIAVGIDLKTGNNRWSVPRQREAGWTSPVVFQPDANAAPLVLLQSMWGVTAHDPFTGDEHWRFEGDGSGIASPVTVDNHVYLAADGMMMIDVADDQPEFAWASTKIAPGASSPVVRDGRLYTVARSGMVNCADSTDGKVIWKLRLDIGSQWATPVVSGNRLFCFGTDGSTAVIDISGEEGRVVAEGNFGETIKASPAVVNDAIYIRSDQHLWKLAKQDS